MAVTPISVSPSLASVLNAAGDRNDVDFNYLLQTAMRESSLDPQAKAAGSSATGLFQFLDTTWLQVMKAEGPRLGYQQYADAITQGADGEYVIKDAKVRAEVLKLREDPAVAADMAAAFTKSNGDYLRDRFGRMPSPGELYIAHFLGAQGAEKMFDAGLKDPDQVAATLFPRAAAANRTIFYDHGHARTIRQVYKALVAQHQGPEALHPGYAVQQIIAQQPQVPAVSQTPAATQVALVQQPVPLAPIDAVSPDSPALTAPIIHPANGPPPTILARALPREGNSRPITINAADAPEIPSRIGPGNMSFASLFSTEPGASTQSPLQPVAAESPLPRIEQGQGAFFSQLYGQQ